MLFGTENKLFSLHIFLRNISFGKKVSTVAKKNVLFLTTLLLKCRDIIVLLTTSLFGVLFQVFFKLPREDKIPFYFSCLAVKVLNAKLWLCT